MTVLVKIVTLPRTCRNACANGLGGGGGVRWSRLADAPLPAG